MSGHKATLPLQDVKVSGWPKKKKKDVGPGAKNSVRPQGNQAEVLNYILM